MSDRSFFDTNVLLYAHDSQDLSKQQTARRLIAGELAAGRLVLSSQVLSEYFVAAIQKLGLAYSDALEGIHRLGVSEVVGIEFGHVLDAARLSKENQLSYWDALIVATASTSGCTRVYTEDLSHGQTILGVEIANPFV